MWVGQQTCGSRRLCPVGQQTCELRGHVLFFCVYRILTVGQIRSWVSTTSDADQV